jgi:PQQ-dependent dehydrogenase (methanol/ethanol family)
MARALSFLGCRAAVLALCAAAALGLRETARADGAAWFSGAQVTSGSFVYAQKCAVCHGARLNDGGAPALAGRSFAQRWNGKSVQTLFGYVRRNMPLGAGESLRGQQYADVVAFVLARNGVTAGRQQFTPDSPMQRALALSGSSAPGAPAAAVNAVHIGALYGKLLQPTTSGPSQTELDGADAGTDDWLMYNKGYSGQRYSTLTQIDAQNAARLRPLCMFQLGEIGSFSTGPVEYDGLLYVTTHLNTYALDATTCKKRWVHRHAAQGPEMNETNKGVAIAGGRVIRGTQDGFLYALDAKTGTRLWERQVADWSIGEGIGAAPLIWNDLVFVAKAGGDWGIHGRMMAFHVRDGTPAWDFDLVPQPDQRGADSWRSPASLRHGGGSSWVTYQLDRETGTLFVPVGNPGPDFAATLRPGANLFTDSVVALDARTGALKWWFQMVPHDFHDYDTTDISLFESGGRRLVAAAGKQGVLYVLDRADGKLAFKLPVTTLLNQDVPLSSQGIRVCPVAGVQWNGPAFSPQSGLLYVNAIDWCAVYKAGAKPTWIATVPYTGLANGFGTNDPISAWSGWINAVDPATGTFAWRRRWPTPMYAAITPTAGNVLFTGDLDGNLIALDARSGETLYSFDTGGPLAGGIITYERAGKQYVAAATGSSGGSIPLTGSSTVVVFGL